MGMWSTRSERARRWMLGFAGSLLVAGHGQVQAAGMSVSCLSGCLGDVSTAGQKDHSINLILRESEQDPIKLRWTTNEAPAPEGWTLRLFAGNPMHSDRLTDLGPLEFAKAGERWFAVRELEGSQLGGGTLQAVIVREQGSNRQLVDWRAFRLLTTAERDRENAGPPPGDRRSISLWPVALRAQSGHGALPPSSGGDRAAWWSLVDAQDQLTDLDLDGEFNGSPGLGIQVSSPWEAGTGENEDPRQKLKDLLTGVKGHTVVMDDLRWIERDASEAAVLTDAGRAGVLLKHYYAVVTLSTNASVKSLARNDLVKPRLLTQRAFAHETSASTRSPEDPSVWASYSLREYGADRELLTLLMDQSADGVPGMTGVVRREGDGGPTTYQAGFRIRVAPWETGTTRRYTRAGLVGVDVVAARIGHGTVKTEGSLGESNIRKALDNLLGRSGERRALDLNDPPEGFHTSPVSAELLTRTGSIPMLGLETEYAQRGEEDEVFPAPGSGKQLDTLDRLRSLLGKTLTKASKEDEERVLEELGLPAEGRFILSASLRSGALVEDGGFLARQPNNLIPINAYAQFVLKFTVAMLPGAELVASSEKILPKKEEIGSLVTVDPTPLIHLPDVTAGSKLTIAAVAAAVVALVFLALVLTVPGLRQFLGGWLRIFTPRARPDKKDGPSK